MFLINSFKNCILCVSFHWALWVQKLQQMNKRDKMHCPGNGIYILTPYQVVYFYLTDATKLASDLTQLLVLAFRKFVAK